MRAITIIFSRRKYDKNPYKAKYQLLINKRESTGLKYLNDWKALTEYSNDMDEIYKDIEEYNSNKKRKILLVFDDMIGDMLRNIKLNPIVTELCIRGRKLDICLVLTTRPYFAISKYNRLDSPHHFIMKIPNKRELQQIIFNNSSDIDFQDFMNLYKKFTQHHFLILVIDTTLLSYNSLRFRKNLSQTIQTLIMTIDVKIRDENFNMILTEKQQKYRPYLPEKFINMNILWVKKSCHLIKVE